MNNIVLIITVLYILIWICAGLGLYATYQILNGEEKDDGMDSE